MSASDSLNPEQFSRESIAKKLGHDPHTYAGHDGLPYRGADFFPADHPGPRMTKQQLPFEIEHRAGKDTHSFHAVSPEYYEPEYEDTYRKHYGSLKIERVGDKNVIYSANVHDDFQGEGVGRALYEHAQAHLGTVFHDNRLTSSGESWAKKVGGPQFTDPDNPPMRWAE